MNRVNTSSVIGDGPHRFTDRVVISLDAILMRATALANRLEEKADQLFGLGCMQNEARPMGLIDGTPNSLASVEARLELLNDHFTHIEHAVARLDAV